jgi:hypothetical protein
MGDRAQEFIDHWESEHVEAVADSEKRREAERLALQCREDAARAGISEQELEDAVRGDLISNMLKALDAAAWRAIEEAASKGNQS